MVSWVNWLCIALVIVGSVLFLVGANTYNAIVGWVGVYMFIGGILLYLVFYVYAELKKREPAQKP
jgi:membrane-bound ClpP family serine protease